MPFLTRRRRQLSARRAHTPTLLQMEVVECSAAALGIVLGWFGTVIPLEQLRDACGVSRDGGNAANILRAARTLGFSGKGFKRSPTRVRQGPFPVIIFWNFNHFLVLEGIAGDTVYLNDPAVGPRRVTWDEFDNAFTGVVLEIDTTADWQPSGRVPSLLSVLGNRLAGSRRDLIFLLLCGLLLTLVGLGVPSFTRIFVDKYMVAGFEAWLLPLFGLMTVAALLIAALTWLLGYGLLRLEMKLAIATSSRFLWHVLRLPSSFFHQRHSADIAGRVGLNDQIAQLLSGELATNLLNLLLIGFYIIVMSRYDLPLTLIGALFALLNILALRYFARQRDDATQRTLHEQGKLLGKSFRGLQIMETLKSTGRESDFFSQWAGTQAQAINAEQSLNRSSEALAAVPPLLSSIGMALIITLGGHRIIAGQLSFGELVAFQALFIAFMLPVNQVVSLGSRLQRTRGEMVRLDDVMEYTPDPHASPSILPAAPTDSAQKLTGHLRLQNVTFGFNPLAEPLLRDINIEIAPGSRVAIVGSSGSGKSTIARLVAGLYQPWEGRITIDGQPISQIPFTVLKQSLAFVDQTIHLFEGSCRDNIALWDDSLPEEQVTQAAMDAQIHQEIVSRHGGYHSPLAEDGSNMSGGQRQRMEIARALVNNPTVLVLDEATSALDPVTEKRIDDNLRRRGCTCLIVAHRLSTIRDCDEIIVLEKGQIVQRGSHDRLIRRAGPYARLIHTSENSVANANNLLDLFQLDDTEEEGGRE